MEKRKNSNINDYSEYIKLTTLVLSFYISMKVLKYNKEINDYKIKNIYGVAKPSKTKQLYNSVNIDRLEHKKYNDALILFTKRVLEKFLPKDLTNFFNNINELKLNPKVFFLLDILEKIDTLAYYDIENNYIRVYNEDEYYTSIFHELFHMASSCVEDGILFSGFSQSYEKYDIGNGINEGYTQVLTERYFGDMDLGIHYPFQVHVATLLEKIVGKRRMEKLYLNGDLQGLIDVLKQYASLKEIEVFISNNDYILYNTTYKDLLLKTINSKRVLNSLKNISNFLVKAYYNKSLMFYKNGIIDEELFKYRMNSYLNNLNFNLELDNNEYSLDLENLVRKR